MYRIAMRNVGVGTMGGDREGTEEKQRLQGLVGLGERASPD